ncbi:MAG: GC-type dockerin domain-anchored protein [Planctomycetota bacterium]
MTRMTIVLVATAGVASAQDASFDGLGFDGLGGGLVGSRANGVSPDGEAIVGGDDTQLGTIAAYWFEGFRFPNLLFDPAGDFAFGTAEAVSSDGDVIIGLHGFFRDGVFLQVAMAWDNLGLGVELKPLPDARPLGRLLTFPGDISNDGSVAVGVSSDRSGTRQPVTWNPATGAVRPLALLPGRSGGQASRISADGRIIAGCQFGAGGTDMLVFWTDGVPEAVDVGLPPEFERFEIHSLSPDASVVGGSVTPRDFDPFSNPIRPAIWRRGSGLEVLGTPPGAPFPTGNDMVQGISERGLIAVGTTSVSAAGSPFSATVWLPDGSVRTVADWLIDDFGLVEVGDWRGLLEATAISDDGTVIVGYGINPLGIKEAWRAEVPSFLCRVDMDGDGEATLFDFLAFQNLFDVEDPRADFDGDGRYTLFDFLAFQTEFDVGCP